MSVTECEECGMKLRDDAKFCDSCGKSITSKKEVNSVTEELKEKEIKEKKRNNIAIVVVIILIVIVVGYLFWVNTDAKTVLVNGGTWTSVHEDYFGDTEIETYVFFDDGTYKHTREDDYFRFRDSGNFKIKNDILYIEQYKNEGTTLGSYTWKDLSLSSAERSLEIISGSSIVIGLDEYTSS